MRERKNLQSLISRLSQLFIFMQILHGIHAVIHIMHVRKRGCSAQTNTHTHTYIVNAIRGIFTFPSIYLLCKFSCIHFRCLDIPLCACVCVAAEVSNFILFTDHHSFIRMANGKHFVQKRVTS